MSTTINEEDKAYINNFCIQQYHKTCDKFSTYTDWEPYWIIGIVQIPLSTVNDYYKYWDKYDKSILTVNSNNILKYYKNNSF